MKNQYGEKIYRLSLNGGLGCPNRDGRLSTGGCIFCSAGGSGDFTAQTDITTQLNTQKEVIRKKCNCNKFIAYFQAYTNTYGPVSYLRKIFTEAISDPDVVILSIATRPDCFSPEIYDLLSELGQIKPVWVELGLQTMHDETANLINRQFSRDCYETCVKQLQARKIPVITHVILGLPGETKEQMLQTVNYIADSNIFGIKLQLLHVLKNTKLADLYNEQPFPLFTLEEYCDFIVDCLEHIPDSMVIHRITGDGPRDLLIAPRWSTDKKRVLNTIQKRLKERDTYQGRLKEKL